MGNQLSRSQWALAIVLVSYTAIYAAWAWLHWGGDAVIVSDAAPIPIVAVSTMLLWRRTSQRSALSDATRYLAGACSCWLVGEVVWFYLEVITDTEPFPSLADPFYLAFYPLAFLGLLAVPVHGRRQRDVLTLFLDTLTIVVAALMALWYLIIGPILAEPSDSALATVLAVGYPIGDLVLVLGLARVLLRRPSAAAVRGLRVLLGGIASLVIADVAFALLELNGNYSPGSLPDVFWVMGFLGVSLAGLCMRSEQRTTMDAQEERVRLSVVPFAGILVGLGLLGFQAAAPRPGSLVPLIVSAGILGVALAWRQSIVQRDHNQVLDTLELLAHTDPLTGLHNRRYFYEVGAARAAMALERGEAIAALVCDIDDFKVINDRYGHATGDASLRAFADRFRQSLRSTDIAARIGGDEFVALLIGCNRVRAEAIAGELRSLLTTHTVGPVLISVSVGIAICDHPRLLEEILHDADAHLYDVKRGVKRPAERLPTP
ncbi:MAG: GGDEF domain-containing protein [Acidimicrobiales bacterium]